MPSRIIREGLLDSQRYWLVTLEARQLLVHLMLLADDFGLVSLAPVFIRRRCFDDAPSPAKIDKLLEQLADADLIRIYATAVDPNSGRCAFIPRFGQRLRLMRCKHPMPPEALFADDEDARTKFNENRAKFKKQSAICGQKPVTRRPEVESKGIEKEVEVKTNATVGAGKEAGKSAEQWADQLGIAQHPGEHKGAFHVRVAHAVERHRSGREDQ